MSDILTVEESNTILDQAISAEADTFNDSDDQEKPTKEDFSNNDATSSSSLPLSSPTKSIKSPTHDHVKSPNASSPKEKVSLPEFPENHQSPTHYSTMTSGTSRKSSESKSHHDISSNHESSTTITPNRKVSSSNTPLKSPIESEPSHAKDEEMNESDLSSFSMDNPMSNDPSVEESNKNNNDNDNHSNTNSSTIDSSNTNVNNFKGQLKSLFLAFCNFGATSQTDKMDNAKFAKFCRETGIITKTSHVTSTDADIVFNKVKIRGDRKIGFKQFLVALEELAKKWEGKNGKGYSFMMDRILSSDGPVAKGTVCSTIYIIFNIF